MKKDQEKEVIGLLKFLIQKPDTAREILRKHGFVFTDLNDPWQKLAFTFYSDIIEAAIKADNLLEYLEGEDDH